MLKNLILLCVISIFTFSCDNEPLELSDAELENNNQNGTDDQNDGDNQNNNNDTLFLLSTKTTTYEDGSTIVENYTYDDNKLVNMTASDGEQYIYTYTNDLITLVEEYDDNILVNVTTFDYDNENRVIMEYLADGENNALIERQYIYNANGTITEIETFVDGSYPTTTYTLTFNNGNLIIEDNATEGYNYTYTYDDKNHPLKNILNRESFFLIIENGSGNNALTAVTTDTSEYTDEFNDTYTYNSDDYPVSCISIFSPGTQYEETETITYTYIEL
jgi:hypothetical protein